MKSTIHNNKIKIAIVGAGISGLSCAHELSQRGFAVSIYEATDSIGGKAKSERTREGYPCEHGFRMYAGYTNIYQTFAQIKTGATTTLMDNLVGTEFNLAFTQRKPIHFFSKRSWLRPLVSLLNFYRISKITSFTEMLFFCKEILLFPFRSRAYYHCLKMQDFASYIKNKKHTSQFQRYIGEWPQALWGSPPEEIATYTPIDSLSVFIYLHFNVLSKYIFFPIMNAPSSEAVFNYWQDFLQTSGVEFYFNQAITHVQYANATNIISSLALQNTQEINADYYIFATPIEKTTALLSPFLEQKLPAFNELSRHIYSFNGIQLYLTGKYSLYPGVTRFEDSPWDLHACYQDPLLWPTTHFKTPVTSILSIIVANWQAPGILYGKSIMECNREEIIQELVAQISAHQGIKLDRTHVHAFHFDKAITFGADDKIIAIENKLYTTPAAMYDQEPSSKTAISNLFLAGDYVATNMHRGTMESANISGKMAANAILETVGYKEDFCPILENIYTR